jgi:hypothetical protein
VINNIQAAKLNIIVEGDIQAFLGINIDQKEDGSIPLTQLHLIDSIVNEVRLDGEGTKIKTIPGKSTMILKWHTESKDFDGVFDQWLIIAKLNYLERGVRATLCTNMCNLPLIQRWSTEMQSSGLGDDLREQEIKG